MQEKTVTIYGEYITLGQFVKLVGLIDTGGQAKGFLAEAHILVNGEEDNRRGKKLYPSDRVVVNNEHAYVIEEQ